MGFFWLEDKCLLWAEDYFIWQKLLEWTGYANVKWRLESVKERLEMLNLKEAVGRAALLRMTFAREKGSSPVVDPAALLDSF